MVWYRGERTRTSGLLLPKQARYQTAPHPDETGTYPPATQAARIFLAAPHKLRGVSLPGRSPGGPYRSQAGLSVSGEPNCSGNVSPQSRHCTLRTGTSTLSMTKMVASASAPPSPPLPEQPSWASEML